MPLNSVRGRLRFAVPSLIGIFMFLTPFPISGVTNTFVGHLKEYLLASLHNYLGLAVMSMSFLVSAVSLYIMLKRPSWVYKNHIFSEHLACSPLGFCVRFISLALSASVVFGFYGPFGSIMTFAENIVVHLVPRLIVLVFVLSLTAPLLLDFGLVQFAAVFAGRWMEPLFCVPGRSAVDGIASWLGSSSMAIVITERMHEAGFYSDREAAVMVSSFSLAGIYNIYALAAILNLQIHFFYVVTTVYTSMIVLAVIMPRLWPLKNIPDTYRKEADRFHEHTHEGSHHTLLERAFLRAEAKASRMSLDLYIHESVAIAVPLLFGTVPFMIALGTFFMAAANLTPFVDMLSAPITALLEYGGVEEAGGIAASSVFAFVDPFLAVAYGQMLESYEARFI
ncbi:MAG: hypothetical protein RR214_05980, partial [Synergistaceae bacterium]